MVFDSCKDDLVDLNLCAIEVCFPCQILMTIWYHVRVVGVWSVCIFSLWVAGDVNIMSTKGRPVGWVSVDSLGSILDRELLIRVNWIQEGLIVSLVITWWVPCSSSESTKNSIKVVLDDSQSCSLIVAILMKLSSSPAMLRGSVDQFSLLNWEELDTQKPRDYLHLVSS